MKTSNLKYRIAIGKIVNGEWKFSHYASDVNKTLLRVTTEGVVERLTRINHPITEQEEHDMLQMPNTVMLGYHSCQKLIYAQWQDVSDTHRVEWGFIWRDRKIIYDNDIIAREYGNSEPVLRIVKISYNRNLEYFYAKYVSGQTIDKHDIGMSRLNEYYYVIGNIHENPELLEARND